MMDQDAQGHHHELQHSHEPSLAEMLDIDAQLLQQHLQEIFDWIFKHQPTPRTIVDLGTGTGTGALGLARTFPNASIVAVDQSEFMLDHLMSAAKKQQLSHRVSALHIDLDTAWPELSDIDLVWAASSMHHMTDPTQVFSRIGNMLVPAGLLTVVEMNALPRYLPNDLGFGTPGLEQRLHDAAADTGWNAHPDWAPTIREAGLEITHQRIFTYDTDENQELIARNALTFLTRLRDGLENVLAAEDLASIDLLLAPNGPQSLARRTDLSVRGSRTVWAARPAR